MVEEKFFLQTSKIKFIYSEKATLLLSYVVPVKSKVEISQNFVAFSEYMNFKQGNVAHRYLSKLKIPQCPFEIN